MRKDYPLSKKKQKATTQYITTPKQQTDLFPDYESTKYKKLYAKNENQQRYIDSLNKNTITIVSGPPGTAKTLFALYYGFLKIQAREIEKIYYIKPNVGSKWERDIGATPGELKDKLNDLLLDPVKDNLPVFMSSGEAAYHLNKQTVEAKLFANIRGCTFRNCVVILDEAQNVPPEAVKTFLTRLGDNCTMVISGDPRQSDVNIPVNGLTDCVKRLQGVSGLGLVEFGRQDIVRHGLIKTILDRYES